MAEVDAKVLTWGSFFQEVKRLCNIAGPMIAVILSQNLLRVSSMMMVRHLGELALSISSLALSLSGVTGFSLFVSLHPRPHLFLTFILSSYIICILDWFFDVQLFVYS